MMADGCEVDLTCAAGQYELLNECFDCDYGCGECSMKDSGAVTCDVCEPEFILNEDGNCLEVISCD